MKKIIVLLAFLMVGLMASVSDAIENYYTATSTSVIIATRTTELVNGATVEREIDFAVTRVYLENGFNDGAFLVVIDSNPTSLINNGGSLPAITSFPKSQWLSPPLSFITSTGTVAGIVGYADFPRGLRPENGLVVIVTGGSSAANPRAWTLELTPKLELRNYKR